MTVTKKSRVQEVSLKYKRNRQKVSVGIFNANEAYDVLKDNWDENRLDLLEEFKIVLLDRANSVLGVSHIATGGVSCCVVDPKIIFATALKANSSSIILAHNHPSGNLTPSDSDVKITEKLIKAAQTLDMTIFDHLILTSDGYFSMAENGLIPR